MKFCLLLTPVQLFGTSETVAHQTPLSMEFCSKNTGVGCHSLLHGIFPILGWNLGLLHWGRILYHWGTREALNRVVLSAYVRLLLFLLAILIPACNSSSPAFCMMYSAYKLNKQGDCIQPCCTLFGSNTFSLSLNVFTFMCNCLVLQKFYFVFSNNKFLNILTVICSSILFSFSYFLLCTFI